MRKIWLVFAMLGAACAGSPERSARPQAVNSGLASKDQPEPAETAAKPAEQPVFAEQGRYFPHRVGRKWELAITVEQDAKTIVSAKHTIEITAKKAISGKEYLVYAFCTEYDGPNKRKVMGERYHRIDESGFYLRHKGMSKELQAVRFPLRSGDAWFCRTKDKAQSFKVEGLADITIDGQAYRDCLVISTQISSNIREHNKEITTYFAKDIGRIKEVVEFRAGFTQIAELVDFQ